MAAPPPNPASAASGSFRQISFPAFLFALYKRDASGELHVHHDGALDIVYLRDGFPVAVRNDRVTVDVLGQILFELGHISADQQNRSLQQMATAGSRHGEVLVEMGLLSPETLRHGLQVQLRRKLNRLFYIVDGRFDWFFIEHGRSAEVHAHPCQVIMLGVRSAWNLDRLGDLDERLRGRCVGLPGGFEPYEPLYELDEKEQAAVRLLQEAHWEVAPFVERSGLGAVGARALLHTLLVTEVLDVRDASAPAKHAPLVPRVAPIDPKPAPPPRPVAPISRAASAPPPIAFAAAEPVGAGESPAAIRARIAGKLASLENADHFSVLEVDHTATAPRIQESYRALSKLYDPSLLSPDLEDVHARAFEIHERLVLANSILADTRERDAYRELLMTGGPKDSLSARKLQGKK